MSPPPANGDRAGGSQELLPESGDQRTLMMPRCDGYELFCGACVPNETGGRYAGDLLSQGHDGAIAFEGFQAASTITSKPF